MKTFKRLAIITLLSLTSSVMVAQSKTGTTIGQFLKIDPSARGASIAGASTSLFSEVSALYYNPAAIGRINKIGFQFTNNQWIADIDYNYAVAVLPIEGIGSISLQLTSLNSGEMDVRTVSQPLGTGERFKVSNFALGAGYGLLLTDRVSVGLTVNFIQERIWNSSYTTFSLSMGVQYQVSENGLQIGASVSNFGPKAGYDGRDLYIDYDFDPEIFGDNDRLPAELRTDSYTLPTLFRVGASYPIIIDESNRITIAADALHPNDNNESINLGTEIKLVDNFFLRAGYKNLFLDDAEDGLVLGAGVDVALSRLNVTFDYGWADYGRLNQVHRFTVGLSF